MTSGSFAKSSSSVDRPPSPTTLYARAERGADEGFGGYDSFWRIAELARLQLLPLPVLGAAAVALSPLTRVGVARVSLPQRIRDFIGADDTTVIHNLFCWLREEEHQNFCQDTNLLPVRRWFEPQHHLPAKVSGWNGYPHT